MTDRSVNAHAAHAFAAVLDDLQGKDRDGTLGLGTLYGQETPAFTAVKDGVEFAFFLDSDNIQISAPAENTDDGSEADAPTVSWATEAQVQELASKIRGLEVDRRRDLAAMGLRADRSPVDPCRSRRSVSCCDAHHGVAVTHRGFPMTREEWHEVEARVHRTSATSDATAKLVAELLGSSHRFGKLLERIAEQTDGLGKLADPVVVRDVLGSVSSDGSVLRDFGGLVKAHDSSPSVDGTGSATVGDGVDAGAAPASTQHKSNIADREAVDHFTSRSLSSFTAGGLVFSVAVDTFPGRNSVLTVSNAWAGISMSTELPARRSAGD
ncbi:MAG: hypothetical protein U5O16_01115 [Rhodococcus sp. (in: high G+C Gram-positive bacteria)]|uniref:hypothetical protein n=1 Tax=Rhodococcus sp. TaxID=1831 RepID=UPI002AD6266B|nr:hypothetical protein [Rhodococcus sp. (in: high G+C Gram-positive bacteria)]